MQLAVRNLLDNADKYAGGARVVRVSRQESRAKIAVFDDGPGLEAEARERMFHRDWRESADGDGRGLGLALVRAVASSATGAGWRRCRARVARDFRCRSRSATWWVARAYVAG